MVTHDSHTLSLLLSILNTRHDSVSFYFMRLFFRLANASRNCGSRRLPKHSSFQQPSFIASTTSTSHHYPTDDSVASSSSIYDRGAVPGLFNVFRNQLPLVDTHNPTTSKLLSRTASGASIALTNSLLRVYTHEIRNETKAIREALVNQGTASGPPDVTEEWKPIIALWTIVYLHRRAPIALCELLPFLYSQYNLDEGQWVLAMQFLYYQFLEQQLSSTTIPPQFYEGLLHSDLTGPLRIFFKEMPAYVLFQNCPENMRESLQAGHSEAWRGMRHWERDLLDAQELALRGDFETALRMTGTLQGEERWTAEFVNTIYAILDAADRYEPDEDRVCSIVSTVLAYGTKGRLHPHTWIRLINFTEHWKSVSALSLLTQALDRAYVGVSVFIHLVQALNTLHCTPLDRSHPAAQFWARKNSVFATMLLHSWRDHFLRTSPEVDESSPGLYSQLMPIYRQYFDTSILSALALPCPVGASESPAKTLPANSVALASMLEAYLRDNGYETHLTLNTYRRFRGLMATQPEFMAGIVNSQHTELLITFLSAISRGHQDTLDLCVGIVSEIVQLINSAKSTTGGLITQPRDSSLQSASPKRPRPLHEGKTWLVLLKALVRNSLFDAAEKILAEIRRNHPLTYPQASALLLEAYARAGRARETHDLIKRRHATGLASSEREWEPLGRYRRKPWSREFIPRTLDDEFLTDISVPVKSTTGNNCKNSVTSQP
jgi:hypothetical protein